MITRRTRFSWILKELNYTKHIALTLVVFSLKESAGVGTN